MVLSGNVVRDRARLAHLFEATVLAAYIYTPLCDVGAVRAVVRFVVLPAMVASGLVMWKLPALRRVWRSRSSVAAHG